jgi:hypothetical protein
MKEKIKIEPLGPLDVLHLAGNEYSGAHRQSLGEGAWRGRRRGREKAKNVRSENAETVDVRGPVGR